MSATADPALGAHIESCTALTYVGPDAGLDRAAHVSAASAIVWLGAQLVIAQDDALWLGVFDPGAERERAGATRPVALPSHDGVRQFSEARGNKSDKPDFEAAVVHDETLYVFGSGSAPKRDRVLVAHDVTSASPQLELVQLTEFYEGLRRTRRFAGSELNLEGVAVVGSDLVLVQRGNGAPRDGAAAVNALGRVPLAALLRHIREPASEPPTVRDIVQYDLGSLDGARLTLTGSAARGRSLAFVAAAESSPDVVRDGAVRGSALGIIAPDGSARWAPLRDADGNVPPLKAEGLAFDPADPRLAFVVLDADDAEEPAELCRVRLRLE